MARDLTTAERHAAACRALAALLQAQSWLAQAEFDEDAYWWDFCGECLREAARLMKEAGIP